MLVNKNRGVSSILKNDYLDFSSYCTILWVVLFHQTKGCSS